MHHVAISRFIDHHRPGGQASAIVGNRAFDDPLHTAPAVNATVTFCARAAPGSRVVFTYVDRRAVEAPHTFHGAERIARFLKKLGERWTFGIDPQQLPARLGLELESDLTATQCRRRYFQDESRTKRGFEFSHVAPINWMFDIHADDIGARIPFIFPIMHPHPDGIADAPVFSLRLPPNRFKTPPIKSCRFFTRFDCF